MGKFSQEKTQITEKEIVIKKEEPKKEDVVQLSLFDSFEVPSKEPSKEKQEQPIELVPTIFEEGQDDLWECPKAYKNFPKLYATEEVESKDKLVYKAFYIPGVRGTWYLNELDTKTGEAFGLVAFQEVEWGYFSVKELLELGAREIDFGSPKTYEELLEIDLKNNLTSEELKTAFYGMLTFEEDLWENLPDENSEIPSQTPNDSLNEDWSIEEQVKKDKGMKF